MKDVRDVKKKELGKPLGYHKKKKIFTRWPEKWVGVLPQRFPCKGSPHREQLCGIDSQVNWSSCNNYCFWCSLYFLRVFRFFKDLLRWKLDFWCFKMIMCHFSYDGEHILRQLHLKNSLKSAPFSTAMIFAPNLSVNTCWPSYVTISYFLYSLSFLRLHWFFKLIYFQHRFDYNAL